jgi:hypothetical protein|tara:strand:- start:1212 stop:1769 length:558 start_codon:yes stop_codon:yes gene_type:complete
MADDRRIIMGTHVVPKEGSLLEDDSTRKWVLDNSINTAMGGKATNTDVASDQTDNNWYKGDNKGTEVTFIGTYQLENTSNTDTLKFLYIKNLNASGGTTLTVSLAAEGEWNEAGDADGGALVWEDSAASAAVRNGGYWNPDYFLEIAPGSSIMLRGDGGTTDTTKCDAVHVYASAESKIEFIIAK